jgi:hypothetical protein
MTDEWDFDIEDDGDFDCDHDAYDVDILTGRAECQMCGHRWFLDEAEWKRYEERLRLPHPPGEDGEP